MLVPEAAVNENYCFSRWEDEIRFSGKVLAVQPETVAQSMAEPPDGHLRFHVPRSNAVHIIRTLLCGYAIHNLSGRKYARLLRSVGSLRRV
jgi:hypothetical protein